MNPEDQLVTKGQVKKALFTIHKMQYSGLMDDPLIVPFAKAIEAIDRLLPVPQGKDCVERDEVRKLLLTIQAVGKFGEDIATELRSEGKKVTHIKVDLLTELAKLPSAVPARQARADEELFGKEAQDESAGD